MLLIARYESPWGLLSHHGDDVINKGVFMKVLGGSVFNFNVGKYIAHGNYLSTSQLLPICTTSESELPNPFSQKQSLSKFHSHNFSQGLKLLLPTCL